MFSVILLVSLKNFMYHDENLKRKNEIISFLLTIKQWTSR